MAHFIGRQTELKELPLHDCIAFWDEAGHGISAFEKLKVLAVTGGVPRYLESINPRQSAEENIQRLCFTKNSILSTEFKKVFSDLYNNKSKAYEAIVRSLADGLADQDTICEKTGLQRGGKISTYLEDLTKSGFVSRDHTWHIKSGAHSKLSQYRLKDNYSRFYLKIYSTKLSEYQSRKLQRYINEQAFCLEHHHGIAN